MDSKTVVSLFRVSTATCKEVILAELSKILRAALSKAQAKLSPVEFFKYNFSIELDVRKDLPDMTLQLQHAKLQGVDTSAFNKLKFHAQLACRSWHLEVASRNAPKLKLLVQYAKDAGFVAQYWGRHAHLTEVTDQKLSKREARKQADLAQSHTNYQVSMMAEELIRIMSVNEPTDIIHPVTGKNLGTFTFENCHELY